MGNTTIGGIASVCYSPIGDIYLDCIVDPDYIPPTSPGDYTTEPECTTAGYYWDNGECKEITQSSGGPYSGTQTLTQETITRTNNCGADQKAVGGECIPVDVDKTEVVGSGQISSDNKGYTCTFRGKENPNPSQLANFYYIPEGVIKVDCVSDVSSVSDVSELCILENTKMCMEGQKVTYGRCVAGDNTKVDESCKVIENNKEGWYCKFIGENDPNSPADGPGCYPPSGTQDVSCIIESDYVEGWHVKKLDPDKTEGIIECDEWKNEIADDGECVAGQNSTVKESKKTSNGRGWYCSFEPKDESWVGYLNNTMKVYCVPE